MLLVGSLVSCYLLVSEIPFFSFKSASKNRGLIYLFIIGCVVILANTIILAIIHSSIAIAVLAGAVCILWYILINSLMLIGAKK